MIYVSRPSIDIRVCEDSFHSIFQTEHWIPKTFRSINSRLGDRRTCDFDRRRRKRVCLWDVWEKSKEIKKNDEIDIPTWPQSLQYERKKMSNHKPLPHKYPLCILHEWSDTASLVHTHTHKRFVGDSKSVKLQFHKKSQRKRKTSVKPVAIHSWQSQDKPFWRREEEWESRNKALSSLPLSDNNIPQEEKTESTWSLQCQVCMCCEERCEEKSQKSQRKNESVPWWLVDSYSFERDCWVTPLIDGTRWLAFLHRATTCGVRTTAWLKRKRKRIN